MRPQSGFSQKVLVFLLLFQSLSAIGGGAALVIRPDGRLLNLPVTLLKHSPFKDFLIPGLFLLIVLGLLPAYTIYALLKRPRCRLLEALNPDRAIHWSWWLAFLVGILLILWIDFQVMFIRSVSILHLIYSLLGVAIVLLVNLPATRQFLRKE